MVGIIDKIFEGGKPDYIKKIYIREAALKSAGT